MNWEQFLLEVEAKIDLAEIALDEEAELGPSLLEPFVPPVGLGPLPADLRERALDVLRKNSELEVRMRNYMETVGRELSATTRAAALTKRSGVFAETATPQYFDSRG